MQQAGSSPQKASALPHSPGQAKRYYCYDEYTSAAVGLIVGNTMVLAHAGECCCLLFHRHSLQVDSLTKDHTEPKDTADAEGADSGSSRNKKNNCLLTNLHQPCICVVQSTECFGLHKCKADATKSQLEQEVTALPDVGAVEQGKDTVVILASAAFWETEGLATTCLNYIREEFAGAQKHDLQ